MKKHLFAIFALVIMLVLPLTLIGVSLASDTVAKTAESALTYEGVAAKAAMQPGIRSMWRVDNAAVKSLEDKGYTVYYGALMGAKTDKNVNGEALAVTYDAQSQSVVLANDIQNAKFISVYNSLGSGSNKFVSVTKKYSVFAYTTLFDFEDTDLYATEIVYAGWLVTVSDSGEVAYYYDYPQGANLATRLDTYEKGDELYYASFTLPAVCDYFINEYRDGNGTLIYSANEIMNVVIDESKGLLYDNLSSGFAMGDSLHIGSELNLVSGVSNMHLLHVSVAEEGYYSVRIRYALANPEAPVRFYLRSRLDNTAVSTFYAKQSAAAVAVDSGWSVPEETDFADEKFYIYLTAGNHVLDLWTETKTTAAVSALLLRCDRSKNALSLEADISNYEVRTNGYEVVEQVASNADNPEGNFALRGYLSSGASLTSTNPTRLGSAKMKTGSYFDYTFSIGASGVYEVIGDVGIGENSALHIYDITGLGLVTGEAWTPSFAPIFTASTATAGGTLSRVTEMLGTVNLKSGNRTFRIYAEGEVNFRSVAIEKDDVNFLTVNYVSESGAVVAPQRVIVLDRYAKYDLPSPAIPGYRPSVATVSGYIVEDKTVTVVYTADATASDRTVTFIYGINGENKTVVTAGKGESITPPAASVSGYHLTWYDAYSSPVYNFATLGSGTVLTAVYEKNVVFTVNATEMTAKNAEFLASDASLLKISHDSNYFTGDGSSYLTIPVSVEYAGIYELRVKGVSDGDFDLAARVDGGKSVYINYVKNNYFVRDTLAMTNAEKTGAYTSNAQLWVYLPAGEHTVDLLIKGGTSVSGRTAATALAVYAAEFTLTTEMRNKGDVVIQQTRTDHTGGQGDSYSGGLYFTATGWIEYSLTVPKDGYYDVYFFVGNNGNGEISAWVDGNNIGSYTGALSNSYRGAEPVAFRAALTKGTHTFRLSADSNARTHVLGVVAAFSEGFIYHDATFIYGDKEVTVPVIHGHKVQPPADAEKEGYVLKWMDESGDTVSDFTVLGNAVYTAKYIDINVTVTFVYGTETVSVPAQIGNPLTPPEEANKEGYVLKWIDEDGNLVTDFTVKGHTTYTARYTGNTDYEIFATEMTTHGQNYLAADPSILVMTSGTSVTLSITVQTTGVYKLGMRGKADAYFEVYLDHGGFRYGELWNNTTGAVYVENTDYTMTAEEKKAAYRYGTGNCYVYLEKGTTYEFLMTTKNAGGDTTGSVGVFSVLFSLEHEVADIAETPTVKSGVSTNASYQNANGSCFSSATAYAEYILTLDKGVYHIGGLAGTGKAAAYHFEVIDAEGNTIGTVSTPSAMYGNYKIGCVPAISADAVSITQSGTYTVRVTITTTNYANNLSGIFAKAVKNSNVTFIYGDTEVTAEYPFGTVATPPAAEKDGYILQWLDENGNVATDFTVKRDAVYTAKYIDKNVTVTFVYGNETVALPTQIGNTVTPPSSAEKEGYILKWLDKNGKVVTDFTVTGALTFTAQYTYAMKEITFIYEGGTSTVLVMLGDKATPPAESKKEGHIIEWLDENGEVVKNLIVTGDATYTAHYVYVVKEITFIYGSESVTYQLLLGEVATSPSAAEKTGFIIQWLDENGNLVTDFTVTGNATYTANYVDYTKVEVLAEDMKATGGSYFLENDKSVLIVKNSANVSSNSIYVTIPVTVYKTGVYAFSARGLANTGFDFGIYDGTRRYGATWSTATSPIYKASADFENDIEGIKTADYRYDVPTCYIYLEAGTHELRFATKQATTTEDSKVALYSVEFSFMYENVAPTPTKESGTTLNASKGIKLAGADAFAEYTLTLSAGVYSFGGFVGTSKASTFTFTILDENGNTLATVQSPNTVYGAYANGSIPATATETVSIRKDGVYTVRVSVTSSAYTNNLFGVFAKWVSPYASTEVNVTFVYEGGEKTETLDIGSTAVPPAEAEKEGYVIEWLKDGEVVTDFTVTGATIYTARYKSTSVTVTFVYGEESVTHSLTIGKDTAVPPAEAEKEGFILEWIDASGNVVTDFTVKGDATYTARYAEYSENSDGVVFEATIDEMLTMSNVSFYNNNPSGFLKDPADGYYAFSTSGNATKNYISITFTVSEAGDYNIGYDYTATTAPLLWHYFVVNGEPESTYVAANCSTRNEGGEYVTGTTVHLEKGEYTIRIITRRANFKIKGIRIALATEE